MVIVRPIFRYFGWISPIEMIGVTWKIKIHNRAVRTAGLRKWQHLYCYLVKDFDKRAVIVTYLDERPNSHFEKEADYSWKTHVQQKKVAFRMTIDKMVAQGALLKKRKILYSYFARDGNERAIIITYLDGEPRAIDHLKVGG